MDTVKTSMGDLLASPFPSEIFPAPDKVVEWSRGLGSWFWSDKFWLPAGLKWEDLLPTSEKQYPDYRDIWTYPFVIAIIMLLIKNFVLNPFVLSPFASRMGLTCRRHRPPVKNKVLDSLYQLHGTNVPTEVVKQVSTGLSLSSRCIERWLRRKQASLRLTVHDKFVEVAYSWLFVTSLTVLGSISLYNKPYFWDIDQCWESYPFQEISNDIWWYYMLGLGYFWSLTLSLMSKPPRKDTATQYVHHFFTILLMSFSWTTNCIRVGALVLLIHQTSDVVLLLARSFRYLKYERTTDCLFAAFILNWLVTRVVLYIFWTMKNIFFDIPPFVSMHSLYVFKVLLIGLMTLNLHWTAMIFYILFKKLYRGQLDDVRSSDDYDTNEDTNDTGASDARLSSG